jgi:hypothetical protein
MSSGSATARLRAALIPLEIVLMLIFLLYLEGQVNAQQLQEHFRAVSHPAQVESCPASVR